MTMVQISFDNLESYIREYYPGRTDETARILNIVVDFGRRCIVLTLPDLPLVAAEED